LYGSVGFLSDIASFAWQDRAPGPEDALVAALPEKRRTMPGHFKPRP
jgi:hypothetical protein